MLSNKMQIKLFEMLFNKDEITWQSIIQDLIKEGKINPWDVDVSLLTKEYMKKLKTLKETDFKISGKIVLAAAFLLKIKSNRLLGADLDYFDRLISNQEDLFEDEIIYNNREIITEEKPKLMPKTPQPRERKVTIYDLMGALENAIETRNRRVIRNLNHSKVPVVEKPKPKKDIGIIIKELYCKIKKIVGQKSKLKFADLVPSDAKKDKVYAFVPLLHLTKQERVTLNQKKHLGEINIDVLKPEETVEEYEKEIKELQQSKIKLKIEPAKEKIKKEDKKLSKQQLKNKTKNKTKGKNE